MDITKSDALLAYEHDMIMEEERNSQRSPSDGPPSATEPFGLEDVIMTTLPDHAMYRDSSTEQEKGGGMRTRDSKNLDEFMRLGIERISARRQDEFWDLIDCRMEKNGSTAYGRFETNAHELPGLMNGEHVLPTVLPLYY